MRRISAILMVLTFAACRNNYSGDVAVVYDNGDKDTLHIIWQEGLELTQRGCLKEPYWDVSPFACSVRTYKILSHEKVD